MELDDLKNIWNKPERFNLRREDEILLMLKGRSKSIVTKLKWSVWFELTFTIIGGMLLLYYSFTLPSGALRWSFISILILFLGYIVYYVKKIRILHRFDESAGNIKTNLEQLIGDLNAYLKFYQKSYSLMYPVYTVLVIMFVIMERGLDQFLEALKSWKMIVYLISFVFTFLVSSLWFIKWYLKKLYGNHLEKLQQMLKDIKENE